MLYAKYFHFRHLQIGQVKLNTVEKNPEATQNASRFFKSAFIFAQLAQIVVELSVNL